MTTTLLTLALAVPALVFAVWPSLVRRRGQAGPRRAGRRRARGAREREAHRAPGAPGARAGPGGGARRRRGLSGPPLPLRRRRGRRAPSARRPRTGRRARRGAPRSPAPGPSVATPWTRQPVVLGAMGVGASRLRGRAGPPRLALLDAGAAGARHGGRPAR